MKTLRGHSARIFGALVALVVALSCVGVGGASAAESSGTQPSGTQPSGTQPSGTQIDLGSNGPTTTITVDGAPIELIPATSYELPAESTADLPGAAADSVASGIEIQGVSSSTGPTSAAGVDAPFSIIWIVLGALVILGGAALLLVRARRAARH